MSSVSYLLNADVCLGLKLENLGFGPEDFVLFLDELADPSRVEFFAEVLSALLERLLIDSLNNKKYCIKIVLINLPERNLPAAWSGYRLV